MKKQVKHAPVQYATVSDVDLVRTRVVAADNDVCRVERLYWSMQEKVGFWSALVGVIVVIQLVADIVFAVALYGAHK